MLTCRQLIDFIAAYVAEELDGPSRDACEWHLHRCPSCRAYLAMYRRTIVLSRALAVEDADVPEELVRAILSLR